MLVKYYKDRNLAYANRKRFLNFNFTPFAQEEQKSILLGDGANTQIKTKKANICDYVTIDNTRWFVTSYVYCNGGQVILNLQRDVIGEQGLGDCFGKIERGYTDSVLKNRKELGLNQVLKERKKVTPSSNWYGEYRVDNHKDEMWGILYVNKPHNGASEININIPAFTPKENQNYDFIENNTKKIISISSDGCYFTFNFTINNYDDVFKADIKFIFDEVLDAWTSSVNCSKTLERRDFNINLYTSKGDYTDNEYFRPSYLAHGDNEITLEIVKLVANYILTGKPNGYVLPKIEKVENSYEDYNGIVLKKDDIYYKYSTEIISEYKYGYTQTSGKYLLQNVIQPAIDNNIFTIKAFLFGGNTFYGNVIEEEYSNYNNIICSSSVKTECVLYTYETISGEKAGQVTIDFSEQNLVDEPYIILVFPLYNVNIEGYDGIYSISKDRAFEIFNNVINSLSGENGYIIDAQIYPYCPNLTGVSFRILDYPFYSIKSTSYTRNCTVTLLPDVDVKKEYIKRKYSLISPEKTGRFDFNFYDYKTKTTEYDGKNLENITISVKTALKPFGIISSAVIVPDSDSLVGITYESDLRGCQPTGNGFQCSLSSNAFETYKRQNSNYQQIFSLQKDELALSHQTERVNEATNAVISSLNASLMGGMAGAAIADGFWGDLVHSQAVGGAIGAATAGATVAIAQGSQISQNNKLREFEKNLQQQMFDLEIGTIKNLPNSVNRISSFNEIILKDFCYIVEIYECTDFEKRIVDNFILKYGYGIGVFDFVSNYQKDGWFLRSTLVSSGFAPNLHNVAANELMGGIYIYE